MSSPSRRLPSWTTIVALAAAYLLVLQATVAGFAMGLETVPARPFPDTILCLSKGGHGADTDGPSKKTHSFPECCTRACPMLANPLALVPAATVLPAAPRPIEATGFALISTWVPPGPWRPSQRARGPPMTRDLSAPDAQTHGVLT